MKLETENSKDGNDSFEAVPRNS